MKVKANKTSDDKNIIEDRITFFYYAFRNILLVGLPLLIISGFVLSHLSFRSSATDGSSGTDNLTISIYSACTLSSIVNNEHNTVVDVGTYKDNIGKTTIKTLCNDGNGYAIYANGYSNNEEGNNKLINTEYPQYSINTGLATSGLTSAWAMKLNNIENDPSPTPPVIEQDYNNTYGIVPNYWTKVASRPSSTTDMSQGSSFTTTYSVYASSSQFAGTYLGQVKYILLHPASPSPPHFYYMQDVAEWKNTLALGESVQAIDKRDGKSYWVTKLKDGNVWMTQNLDFDITTYINDQGQEVVKPLTSEDTDLTDHSLTGAYIDGYNYNENTNITTWVPTIYAKTINFAGGNNEAVTGWESDKSTPYSASKTNDINTGHSSLGNYYNWTAAIASNNSSSLTGRPANPENSICPKGWRLPFVYGGSSGNDFSNLRNLYSTPIVAPLYFVQSGRIYNGSIQENSYGYYWSSSVYSAYDAYFMSITDVWKETADVNGSVIRNWGLSIRCIAR